MVKVSLKSNDVSDISAPRSWKLKKCKCFRLAAQHRKACLVKSDLAIEPQLPNGSRPLKELVEDHESD